MFTDTYETLPKDNLYQIVFYSFFQQLDKSVHLCARSRILGLGMNVKRSFVIIRNSNIVDVLRAFEYNCSICTLKQFKEMRDRGKLTYYETHAILHRLHNMSIPCINVNLMELK